MSDYIVRATAGNGSIRAFAATTWDLVQHAREIHHTSPVASAALGRMLTAAAMMGSMLKGEKDIVTLQIRGEGPLQGLVVTSDSHARVKGYVFNPNVEIPDLYPGKLNVGGAIGNGYMSVIKDIGMREPYAGRIELVSRPPPRLVWGGWWKRIPLFAEPAALSFSCFPMQRRK